MDELNKYYSLDEVLDRDIIIGTLKKLKRDGRIEFYIESEDNVEYFYIEDIDLEDHEIEDLIDLFDENDVVPYFDKDDKDDEDWDDDNSNWDDY